MKVIHLISLLSLSALLVSCSGLPKECVDSWEKMEQFAKQSGISEDSLKEQKKAFEEEIKKLSKEDAIQACKAQTSILNMAK